MIDELKSQLGIGFLEKSAKTRQNVKEAFYELVNTSNTSLSNAQNASA